MTVALIGFGKRAMRDAARQAVPPRVIKSLKAILAYLETSEEGDYHATPIGNRNGHVYRHLRRVRAWLTPWAWDGWNLPTPIGSHNALKLPIIYHPSLEHEFDFWSHACGCSESFLRRMSENAIRTRHSEARLEHPADNGRETDVFTLSLGGERNVHMYYSIEEHAVAVRGYYWDSEDEPKDDLADLEGGGFYCDSLSLRKRGGNS